MKTTKILLIGISLFSLMSCGEKSYDEKVAEVCDCFKEKATPQECFIMQSDLGKTLDEDERIKFNNETNDCAN